MARTINIGVQGFETVRTNGDFYVDKTSFVREWWNAHDEVTLICRPRRFGKTLNLDTVRCFFSTEFAERGQELFGGLEVWNDPAMRTLQGTVPVISVSFARVKQGSYDQMLRRINRIMAAELQKHRYLLAWDDLTGEDRLSLSQIRDDMDAETCSDALNKLCMLLHAYHKVKPIVLLDEYDAPMQEAWTGGFWDEASHFMRDLMNSTFKTNPSLSRGLITGVTRVGRESIFSDLNNLRVVTASTPAYQTCFGFTEQETFAALDEFGLGDKRQGVRDWYDGFVFDGIADIYNPWSITQFIANQGIFDAYWANTSGNSLASSVVRRGGPRLKQDFEILLKSGTVLKVLDEQVVFSDLERKPNAIWALLLAAGYVKALGPTPENLVETPRELALTNREVRLTFASMIEGWFADAGDSYDEFSDALLAGDTRAATYYLADVTRSCISSFDSGNHPAESEPERFYHGLVLGLLVHLRGRYAVESNRESGFGRYDVMLVPNDGAAGVDPALVIEFKVFDPDEEKALSDTVARAREQIERKAYVTALVERGISSERIRSYGIAFRGKEVLIG